MQTSFQEIQVYKWPVNLLAWSVAQISETLVLSLKTHSFWVWGYLSAIKSTYNCRGHGFGSQHQQEWVAHQHL